jgi:hypothetical protein
VDPAQPIARLLVMRRASSGRGGLLGALQTDYEPLLHALGPVTANDIERLRERLALAADPRDMLAARNFLTKVLDVSQHHCLTGLLSTP